MKAGLYLCTLVVLSTGYQKRPFGSDYTHRLIPTGFTEAIEKIGDILVANSRKKLYVA